MKLRPSPSRPTVRNATLVNGRLQDEHPREAEQQQSAAQARQPAVRPVDHSVGCMGLIGVLFLLVSVGPLIILLNGGYSIVGMGWLAAQLGEYAKLFWAVATAYTVDVPIAARAGLPIEQPVLPWMMVIGMSFLQINLISARMRGARLGLWITGAGTLTSLFDYATTAVGLALLPWMRGLGFLWYLWLPVAGLLAIPITFGFEGLIARLMRGR